MQKMSSAALAFALAAGAAVPAHAWEYTIAGASGFQQNLAPTDALVAGAIGDVCLLSNDSDPGGMHFAHFYAFHAQTGTLAPWQSVGSRELATLGLDCRFGPAILGYAAYDEYTMRRSVKLVGFMLAGSTLGPAYELPSYGAIETTHFGVDAAQHAVVLREKIGGNAYDLQAFDLNTLASLWQSGMNPFPVPAPHVLAMRVAADGTTSLLGTTDDAYTPALGMFLQRYDATGQPQPPSFQYADPMFAQIGAAALSPGGVAYFVRRDRSYLQDQVWQMSGQSPWGNLLAGGCCTAQQVIALQALPDDGALVATSTVYGWGGALTRYAANGDILWRADGTPVTPPGTELLGVIGDRAGRALIVTTEPVFGGPPQAVRSVRLSAYSETGAQTWTRVIENVRVDHGNPLRFAVSSDDRVVLALNAYVPGQDAYGILVQGFPLDQPTAFP